MLKKATIIVRVGPDGKITRETRNPLAGMPAVKPKAPDVAVAVAEASKQVARNQIVGLQAAWRQLSTLTAGGKDAEEREARIRAEKDRQKGLRVAEADARTNRSALEVLENIETKLGQPFVAVAAA